MLSIKKRTKDLINVDSKINLLMIEPLKNGYHLKVTTETGEVAKFRLNTGIKILTNGR